MSSDTDIQYLTEDEALVLAATAPVGRVVYTRDAIPAAHLVNFKLDGKDVIFKTRKGAKFAAVLADALIAFEVDEIDPATRSGWTVTLTGRSRMVTEPEEQERLLELDVDPWLPGREYFVRVMTAAVTGRRVSPDQLHGNDADLDNGAWRGTYL